MCSKVQQNTKQCLDKAGMQSKNERSAPQCQYNYSAYQQFTSQIKIYKKELQTMITSPINLSICDYTGLVIGHWL